jgi:acetyl-CoA carboxylase biotin carboxyl carrier protein
MSKEQGKSGGPSVDIDELRTISEWLEAAGIERLEIRRPGYSLRLIMARGADVPVERPALEPELDAHHLFITAPVVGIFLTAHPARSAPFVRLGDTVSAGDVIGLLKVGLIYQPVIAPSDGTVVELLAEPDTLVGFGTPLMQLRPVAAVARR